MNFYQTYKIFLLSTLVLFFNTLCLAQPPCTPLGDQTTYGTNDVWIGYVYDNADITNYAGYVTEGITGNPNFDESFGGDNVTYATNGCGVLTTTFSVRYKLNKTFTNNNYDVIVGGDDGYRFSIDGGATWIINNWGDHAYATTTSTITLNGNYNLVLEFYENAGQNRVTFNISPACVAGGSTTIYGNSNVWIGYVYDGTSHNPALYKGFVNEGTVGSPNFDESFGGNNTNYNTSACPVQTETFSVRYRLQKTFASGNYSITVGGDDGYRFSIDGGATWAINNWSDHAYTTTTSSITLNGTYNLVLEFYENGGGNRVSFNIVTVTLPVRLVSFTGTTNNTGNLLNWQVQNEDNLAYYEVQKSADGINFNAIDKVVAKGLTTVTNYNSEDKQPLSSANYYKLRMVDNNNNFTYSPTIKLNTVLGIGVRLFPTQVTNNRINITTGKVLQNTTLVLYDITGKFINTITLPQRITAGTVLNINLSNSTIANGNYILLLTNNDGTKVSQLIYVR
jgi:hypothetical protein